MKIDVSKETAIKCIIAQAEENVRILTDIKTFVENGKFDKAFELSKTVIPLTDNLHGFVSDPYGRR